MTNISLLATGDVCLKTSDDKYPFEAVDEILEEGDISFGNLEVVLSDKGNKKRKEKAVSLYEPPHKAEYLKEAGYDILNISNNHTADLGREGLESTKKTLNNKSIPYIYDDGRQQTNCTTFYKSGMKIGFLGYPDPLASTSIFDLGKCFSVNKINKEKISDDIQEIKKECDIVVVSIHWGIENIFYPSPNQIEMAHDFVDSGADVILGHHPHVIQGIEEYKNGLIAYSLGNFQFYPTREMTDISYILSIDITSNEISSYDVIPMKINNKFKPYIPNEGESVKIRKMINRLSAGIQGGEVTEENWYEHIAEEYLRYNLRSYKDRVQKNPMKALPEAIVWSVTPFCMKCYLGLVRQYRNTDNEKQTKIGL